MLYSGAFLDICNDKNHFEQNYVDDPLNPLLKRVVIEISCPLGVGFYKNTDTSYSLTIQGVRFPASLNQTGRIIIELREKDLLQQQINILLQTSESEAFTEVEKDAHVYTPTTPSQFKVVNFQYPLSAVSDSCVSLQITPSSQFTIQTYDKLVDSEQLNFAFSKQSFRLIKDESLLPISPPSQPMQVLVECTATSLSGIDVTGVLSNCSLRETTDSYVLKANIFPSKSNAVQWSVTDLVILYKKVTFLPIFSPTTSSTSLSLQYILLQKSGDILNISQQTSHDFFSNSQAQMKICSIQFINFQSDEDDSSLASQDVSNQMYFKEIQITFLLKMSLSDQLILEIDLVDRMKFQPNSLCSIDIEQLSDMSLACSINTEGHIVQIEALDQYLRVYSSLYYPLVFVLRISDISIDQISSRESPLNIPIGWKLYSNDSNQTTSLSGSQMYTFQLQCTDSKCSECVNNSTNCLMCQEGYYLEQDTKKCVVQCKDNAALDTLTKSCVECKTQSDICISCNLNQLAICTKCSGKYILSPTGYCHLPIPDQANTSNQNKSSISSSEASSNEQSWLSILKLIGQKFFMSSSLVGCVIITGITNMILSEYRRRKRDSVPFIWVSFLLFLANIIDLAETPYIIISITFNQFDIGTPSQISDFYSLSSLIYLVANLCAYLYCLFIITKVMILDESTTNVFCVFQRSDSHAEQGNGLFNGRNDLSLAKKITNMLVRCLIAGLSKCFCIVYSNIAQKKGWLCSDQAQHEKLFQVFYRILSLHTLFNIVACTYFAATITDFSLFPNYIAQEGQDYYQHFSYSSPIFTSTADLVIFKFFMAFICLVNCLHVQRLSQQPKPLPQPSPSLVSLKTTSI